MKHQPSQAELAIQFFKGMAADFINSLPNTTSAMSTKMIVDANFQVLEESIHDLERQAALVNAAPVTELKADSVATEPA